MRLLCVYSEKIRDIFHRYTYTYIGIRKFMAYRLRVGKNRLK